MAVPAVQGGAVPSGGAALALDDLEVPTVGETSPYPPPRVDAEVIELHPATEGADTEEIPAGVEHVDTVEREAEEDEPAPAPVSPPTPNPTPAVDPDPGPAVPPAPPAPPEPETLTVPPRPEVESTWEARLSTAFSGIFWFSVLIGLVGQIVGFARQFGGTPTGIAGAVLIGGVFEFLMITGSSRGFHAIRSARAWHEFVPYLVVSTAAAGVAAYMNFTHWAADMALYFGGLTVAGYVSHIFSHLHPALRSRQEMQDWKAEKERVENEIKRREAEQREAYEKWLREQEERAEAERREREVAAERERQAAEAERERREKAARIAEENPELLARAEKLMNGRKKRVDKNEAVALGVAHGWTTKAALRDGLAEHGFQVSASEHTLKDWAKTARQHADAA